MHVKLNAREGSLEVDIKLNELLTLLACLGGILALTRNPTRGLPTYFFISS